MNVDAVRKLKMNCKRSLNLMFVKFKDLSSCMAFAFFLTVIAAIRDVRTTVKKLLGRAGME